MNKRLFDNCIMALGLDTIEMIERNEMLIRPGPVDKEDALLKSIKVIRDSYKRDQKKTVSIIIKDDKSGYIELLDSEDNSVNIDYLPVNSLKEKIREAIKDGVEGYCIWLPVEDGRFRIAERVLTERRIVYV